MQMNELKLRFKELYIDFIILLLNIVNKQRKYRYIKDNNIKQSKK